MASLTVDAGCGRQLSVIRVLPNLWLSRAQGTGARRWPLLPQPLVTPCRDASAEDVFTLPVYFSSDWLNEYWDALDVDDYRFIYMGPAGTWYHASLPTSSLRLVPAPHSLLNPVHSVRASQRRLGVGKASRRPISKPPYPLCPWGLSDGGGVSSGVRGAHVLGQPF